MPSPNLSRDFGSLWGALGFFGVAIFFLARWARAAEREATGQIFRYRLARWAFCWSFAAGRDGKGFTRGLGCTGIDAVSTFETLGIDSRVESA